MSRRSARGFTLVELLVALALFALVSGFAYRGLAAMLDSREALRRDARKWRDTALFVGRVERDLAAVLARPAVGPSGTLLPAVSSVLDTPAREAGLSLSRSGSPLQRNVLAAPQRVAYRLRGGRIERLVWPGLDAAPRAEPVAVPVLAPVRALAFRFLDAGSGEWRGTWGPPGGREAPPAAVEVRVELGSGETIVRLVDLPR